MVVTGEAMLLVSLIGAWTGSNVPGSLGEGQILLALPGCLVVLTGLLGRRRSAMLYRNAANMLLKILVLFACLELGVRSAIEIKHWLSHSEKTLR